MAIGVEYETFWRITPRRLHTFHKAYINRKREEEISLYLQGRYTFDAISIAMANAFAKKGSKPHGWIEEPYHLIPLTEEEKAEKAEIERQKAIAFFNAMIPNGKEGG